MPKCIFPECTVSVRSSEKDGEHDMCYKHRAREVRFVKCISCNQMTQHRKAICKACRPLTQARISMALTPEEAQMIKEHRAMTN